MGQYYDDCKGVAAEIGGTLVKIKMDGIEHTKTL